MQAFVFVAVLASLFPSFIAARFNATEIADATKEMWCNAQVAQCPALCADTNKGTESNLCYPENLAYECICDDGLKPNLTEYSATIPYYLCTMEQSECIADCNANAACAANCRKTHLCGATNPKKYNKTKTTNTKPTDATSTVLPTDAPNSDIFDAKPSSASSVFLGLASAYGLGIMATSIAVGVAFIGL